MPLVPALVLVAYAGITFMRVSDLPPLVEAVGLSGLTTRDVVRALATRSGGQRVLGQVMYDLSYRTVGLEAVAAIIDAQAEGRLQPKWGKVAWSGFLQALPAALRPTEDIPQRLKTARYAYGQFSEGDWVSSVLAEFTLDFGALALIAPAVLAGVGLSLVDRLLCRLGTDASLQSLLVVRLAWLLGVLLFELGIADRTLLFFRASVGYTVLMAVVTNLARLHFWRGAPPPPRSEAPFSSSGIGVWSDLR